MKLLVMAALVGGMFATPLALSLPAVAQAESVQKAHRRSLLTDLNLTLEQWQRIQQIRQNARAQLQAVLTPEQRQQLSQLRTQNREQRHAIMKNLNLTEAQKAQIRQIRAHMRQQIQAILTPEQRQQMEARRRQWQQQQEQPTNPTHKEHQNERLP
jgi:protein CpxP